MVFYIHRKQFLLYVEKEIKGEFIMKNKMNKNNMLMSVITGLILSFWIICVSAIMIPVLFDEAKISSEMVISSSVND